MNEFAKRKILHGLISKREFDAVMEYANIEMPEKGNLLISEYDGKEIRAYNRETDCVHILVPRDLSVVQENSLAQAIGSGEIFDDTDKVDKATDYVTKTVLPIGAMTKHSIDVPHGMTHMISAVIGKMDDDGHIPCDPADIKAGCMFTKDLCESKDKGNSIHDIVDNFLGTHSALSHEHNHQDEDDEKDTSLNSLPIELGKDTYDVEKSLRKKVMNFEPDDCLEEGRDYEEIDPGKPEKKEDQTEEEYEEECQAYEEFFFNKPRKLKPIPARDITTYIASEINAIRDSNDQAMLAGYCSSKMEIADFYLNCLETEDDRYIVPHNKQFLQNYLNDLNRLLTQILKVRPVQRTDRVWKVNVNYPENWRG